MFRIIKNILIKIFPPFPELAVFITMLSLIVIVFVDQTVNAAVSNGIATYFEMDGPQGFWDLIARLFLMPAFVVAVIAGSLYLPFTNKDYRFLCGLVPVVHLGCILVANVKYLESDPDFLNAFYFLYSLLWIFVTLIRLRAHDIDSVISPENTSGIHAIVLGSANILLVIYLLKISGVDWVIAYATAFYSSVYVSYLIRPVIVNLRRAD